MNAALGLMEPVVLRGRRRPLRDRLGREEQKLYGLNASGRRPYALTIDEVQNLGLQRCRTGRSPQTVPGCVDGWFELHKRFGKLPMKLLAPAIRYAERLSGRRR